MYTQKQVAKLFYVIAQGYLEENMKHVIVYHFIQSLLILYILAKLFVKHIVHIKYVDDSRLKHADMTKLFITTNSHFIAFGYQCATMK